MQRQLLIIVSLGSVLAACSGGKSSKLAADSNAAASANMRDLVLCKDQTEHDQLKAGECTGTDFQAPMLWAGQFSLRNHDDQRGNMGCWGVEGPDKTVWIDTYVGDRLVGYDKGVPKYQSVYEPRPYPKPDYRCDVQASSHTYNPNTTFIQMQEDGNAIFYASTNQVPAGEDHNVIFYGASHTENNPGAVLRLNSRGELFITDANGHRIWSR